MHQAFAILLIFLVVYALLMLTGVHTIHQGYVGIYKYKGVLSPTLSSPGLHFMVPFFNSYQQIQISVQTDQVLNIPCGTSGGTLVYFAKIQVVNKLKKEYVYQTIKNYTSNYDKFWIFNKIHHQINQFCSKHTLQQIYIDLFEKLDEQLIKSLLIDLNVWAPGIQILSIRITKPWIPQSIRNNFQLMQQTKVQYLITSQRQKVIQQQQFTRQKQAVIQAQSELDVKLIQLEKQIKLKENDLKIAIIEAQMSLQRAKSETDALFLASNKQVQLYPKLFSDAYLQFQGFSAFTQNVTMVLGQKIPNIVTTLK